MKLTSKTINYTVDTVEQLLLTTGTENDTVIVTDENRGGVFIYREDNASTNNGGTIFNGWTRQYDGAVNIKWFGAKGDGITDDTIAVQAAINSGLNLVDTEGCTFRLTAPIVKNTGFTITGVRAVVKSIGGADLFNGTFFYFDHTGKGFTSGIGTGYATDFNFVNIATRRNQPNPTSNWTPNDHDYDFYFEGIADVTFNDCLLLNPTRGIGAFGGGGRFNIYNLRMQPFKIGINIDTVYDVCRIDQLHVWPFWRDDMNVHTYCMNNMDAIISGRNDNPMLSNIFTIFARAGIRFVNGAGGITSKVHLSNCDFDRGAFGIWYDSVNNTTGQIVNMTHQGENGFAGSKAIFINGTSTNNYLEVSNMRTMLCSQNGIRVEGTNNTIKINNLGIHNYDQSGAGFPAIEAYSTNTIEVTGFPDISPTNNKYGITGTLLIDDWRRFTAVVSCVSGAITTLGDTDDCYYKVIGKVVHVKINIRIIDIGTSSGGVTVNIPYGTISSLNNGHGREVNVNGKALNLYAALNQNKINIFNYDNSHPAVNGCRLTGIIQYALQ